MLLLQSDNSHCLRKFVRKKGCHPHKPGSSWKHGCFSEGKPTAGVLLFEIPDLLEIPRDKADSRLTGTGGKTHYWWHPYWHRRTWQELTLHCSMGCVFMALRLNLQPQGNMSFWKPEENNSNSVISYQSRLFMQPANHKSVALDYKEARRMSGYHFVQTCMKDKCAKNPAVLGGHYWKECLLCSDFCINNLRLNSFGDRRWYTEK